MELNLNSVIEVNTNYVAMIEKFKEKLEYNVYQDIIDNINEMENFKFNDEIKLTNNLKLLNIGKMKHYNYVI